MTNAAMGASATSMRLSGGSVSFDSRRTSAMIDATRSIVWWSASYRAWSSGRYESTRSTIGLAVSA